MKTLALLHPGQMGASVGAAAKSAGVRVLWASDGRGAATRERAESAGLEDVKTLEAAVGSAPVALSVCPPDAAGQVVDDVLAAGFRGVFVDANAIAPRTARELAERVTAAGARYVDGGIIGLPAWKPGSTRLYLSGDGADDIASLFSGSALEAIAIPGAAGAASALKMSFAAWTKGSSALLGAIRALAEREGVDEALLAEWARSIPDLPQRSEGSVRATAPKAWRFVGEMEEIAATFRDAGLPGGFHDAAAEVYRRLAPFKDASPPPGLAEALAALLDRE